MVNELLELLESNEEVAQSQRWHPEGNALYHMLQVYALARERTDDPCLQAAALVHDVGKVLDSQDHAQTGAGLLEGLLAPRVIWLVQNHLDLVTAPCATRRALRGTRELHDLQLLRAWDLAGRVPGARVWPASCAVEQLFGLGASLLIDPIAGEPAPMNHEPRKERF
jgi:hypothetical protein